MGNQEHRGEASQPEAKYFILHLNARKGIESTERFVKKERKETGVENLSDD
jgi:hypothetical protein